MPVLAQPHEDALSPGFMVIHGNRLEALRGLAVEWMKRHPLGPLENETILVQSNGIGQWLKLALAEDPAQGGAGIAAALDVTLPARFLWQAYRAVLEHAEGDVDAVPATSPFDKSRLVWRLLRLLPGLLDQPAFAPLARFLEDDADLRKHHQLAERLADLFDQYQVYRADWLDAWAAGEDVLISARGEARPLDEAQRWQPALWRAICHDVAEQRRAPCADVDAAQGAADIDSSRARVHRRFLEAAESLTLENRPRDLPRRVVVFGISSLPRQALEALAAIARVSQVLLCVHNPCEHYWADIIEHKELLRAERRRQRRKAGMPERLDVLGDGDGEEALHLHAQPLLAAWGKQGRDYLRLLDEHDDSQRYEGLFEREALRIDLFEPCVPDDSPGLLLQQLQDDIRALRPLAETRDTWPAVDPTRDDSIVFHVAHGPQREVEILHDQLLAAFSDDPELRPRDIIVMVPDIDHYAPHIQAVFGQYERGQHASDDPRYIPFTLSDQADRHRQPLLVALEKLVRLPELRFAVSDLLDLLEVPALRARFGLAEEDLPTLARWIEGAGIRWGLDARQRGSLDLPEGLTQNTWAFGLRRLLLGYAVGNSGGAWQGIEPFDDIGGLEAGLAGPLAQLLETLEAQWQRLRESHDVEGWVAVLRELLEACFSAEEADDSLMLARLEQGLQEFQESAREAGLTRDLPLSVVREHWLAQIDEHSLSQRFLAGAVNFATLMPMRAIPFRRVCLLGMNDGDYPRHQPPLDIDLMHGDYRPGDRSRREDDRYLFLEALLSARRQLYVSWVGRSIVDNAEKPPSVLVGQLRDHLAAGWHTVDGDVQDGKLLVALTTEHPLQPFSRAYFPTPAEQAARDVAAKRLFTYAHEWRDVHPTGAEEGLERLQSVTPPLLPFEQENPLTLAQLGGFLRDPAKAFFTTRLKVFLEREDVTSLDHEPFTLDGLTHWQLQDALIQAQRLAIDEGRPREPALHDTLMRLEGQGVLAMGAFAERMRESLAEPMEALFEAYRQALDAWPQPVEEPEPVRLELPTRNAPPLEDWLDQLRVDDAGRRCRLLLLSSSLISQGRGRPQYRWAQLVRPWVAHLAGNLEAPLTTELLSKAGHVTLPPLEADTARQRLGELIGAWQAGMREPLPLAVEAAFAWLGKVDRHDGSIASNGPASDAWQAARKAYEGDGFVAGEVERNPYLAHRWPDFAALMAAAPADDGERLDFATLTERLLAPLYLALKGDKNGGDGQ
ncbi:exodeoxyribonuclease V subunit gamma [Halomonas stenophila]|uniref:RecBCD enzyme subunit RecC n=1 Tax=Halomonas stenophila TaxID=795312 RepID=A0A7W5EV15_9GAMM|nr:exodeoxyribonuclease V subunit gamma [Halomonas stenophila]MBB3231315.1 exodeoxyribonuclease V gamma subunit [Halomonas stenophila]